MKQLFLLLFIVLFFLPVFGRESVSDKLWEIDSVQIKRTGGPATR